MNEARTARPASGPFPAARQPGRGTASPVVHLHGRATRRPAPERADKWISRAATVTVAGLACRYAIPSRSSGSETSTATFCRDGRCL
jgi:hypothetical protein